MLYYVTRRLLSVLPMALIVSFVVFGQHLRRQLKSGQRFGRLGRDNLTRGGIDSLLLSGQMTGDILVATVAARQRPRPNDKSDRQDIACLPQR